ncbi:MAG TPA: LysM peptidoglycan-binding domain-containing protein [Bacillota bacterium]|jgi:spore germination protein|nr:LysM peptidoglycan-binding domain-containing protein [Bacillota bacterium]HOL11156.1 LysM peptidoglycan-binding domain-containing protein [Bacillota bacterium]HPO97314.1 LysM peptidoglycan-binding domain-containing protein [Bacillota bacterium]
MEIYIVQPGDTLFAIARRFNTTVTAIQALNQFPNPDQLVIGQAILIPTPQPTPLQYMVVAGDTLFQLAQLFDTTVTAIVQTNNLINPNLINIGTVLIIPDWSQINYQIRQGDTLYQIAQRYGVSLELIVKVNQITNPALIYPGQIISIPQQISVPAKRPIETFGYFFLYNLAGLERSLTSIAPYITYGGLYDYPINSDGKIEINPNTGRAIALLNQFNIQPMAVITNWTPGIGFDPDLARNIMGDEAVKQRTIANIINLLTNYNFTGINIDFENMYPADRQLYTAFIRDLAATVKPRGYLLSLAIAPKASDLPNSPWVGTFDYAALGELADFVFLMTYEWGWVGGPPMPIAPINLVRQVLNYAVTQIPPEKILQGIPLYAYNWPLPDTPETTATPVNLVDVYNLAYRFNAVINFEPLAQSPWFNYTDEQNSGHEVWFEDVRSVKAKYQTASNLALRGVGYWGYVNEPYGFPQNWPMLEEFFTVIKNNRL